MAGQNLVDYANQVAQDPGTTSAQTVPLGQVAGQIMAGGPPILTPQQMLSQAGIQPYMEGHTITPRMPQQPTMVPTNRPTQSAPYANTVQAKTEAKWQNMGNMLGNLAGAAANAIEKKKFDDTKDVISDATTALQSQQNAKDLAAMYPNDINIQRYAQGIIQKNQTTIDEMVKDSKKSKILRDAKLDYNDPKKNEENPVAKPMQAAIKEHEQKQKAGIVPENVEDKKVQDMLQNPPSTMGQPQSMAGFKPFNPTAPQQTTPQTSPVAAQAGPIAQPQANTTQGVPANVGPLGRAIAFGGEGYGKPGALPTRTGNPGDITDKKGSTGSTTSAGGEQISNFQGQEGWQALQSKLEDIAAGKSKVYSPDMTISQLAEKWAPAKPGSTNNPKVWAANVAKAAGVTPDTPIKDLIKAKTGAPTTGTGQPTSAAQPQGPTTAQRTQQEIDAANKKMQLPVIPGQTPPKVTELDATKTPTPMLDRYNKMHPTTIEQNPLYAQAAARQAMMEKAYYEKMAPEMMTGYMNYIKQNASLQSKEYIARMHDYTSAMNEYNRLQGQQQTAETLAKSREKVEEMRDARLKADTELRVNAAKEMVNAKNSNPWTSLKTISGIYSQNFSAQRTLEGAIAQVQNQLGIVGGTDDAANAKRADLQSKIDRYNSELASLQYANDKLRVLQNQVLTQNPGIQQSGLLGGGGGFGGGGFNFNQQVSPNTSGGSLFFAPNSTGGQAAGGAASTSGQALTLPSNYGPPDDSEGVSTADSTDIQLVFGESPDATAANPE